MNSKKELKELHYLPIDQLKLKLKNRGLSVKGRKKDLIERLTKEVTKKKESEMGGGKKSSPSSSSSSSAARQRTSLPSAGTNGSMKGKSLSAADLANMRDQLHRERDEREAIVLWRHPITTLQYFFSECAWLLNIGTRKLWRRKKTVVMVLCVVLVLYLLYTIEGAHQGYVSTIEKNLLWWGYWIGLGILSSVGFGTGLHTFLLYLGPHIAAVTLAAYECQSVDFPEPPYPSKIICPDDDDLTGTTNTISIWTIMSKVRFEAVMWGAGTAIGELPPYFMARAARLSGTTADDDEFEEIEELLEEKKVHPEDMTFMERAKLGVHSLVEKVGFFGILACASIPNPLFDLAGITCGHFLVPFWTFFGATLIGKAIIKMHIQKLFIIFIFSKHHVEQVVNLIGYIPKFGHSLQTPFKDFLEIKRKEMHRTPGSDIKTKTNILAWIFEKLIIVMFVYFLLSIINSTAQSYHKRLCKEKRKVRTN